MTTRPRPGKFDPNADMDTLCPFIPWSELRVKMDYRYDEHVTLIGPTRRGKTTLAFEFLELRKNVIVLATKKKDVGLAKLLREYRFKLVKGIVSVHVARKQVIWPAHNGLRDVKAQAAVMDAALEVVYRDGNRTAYVDEVHYFAEFLHLSPILKLIWQQGASNGISLVAGFQRPAWVPRDAYSGATHIVVFGTADLEDARTLGGLGGLNSALIRHVVAWLAADASRRHDFCYVNTRTGLVCRSNLRT